MTTVQLRRYEIKPGEMKPFLEWWQTIAEVRAQYGFRVLFALVDEMNNEFTWAVGHNGDAGDFKEAEQVFIASPERAAAFEGVPARVASAHVSMVTIERGF